MSRLSGAAPGRRVAGAHKRPAIGGQRARSAADKTLRREHLLDAASRLLQASPFDAITVAGVAREASLAKASAYTYFATREALFLALVARELSQWMAQLERRLAGGAATATTLARDVAATLGEARTLRLLLARLHSTLESNVPAQDLLWFKRFLAGFLDTSSALIERALPALRGKGEQVCVVTHALLIGLGQLAEPSPNVAAVLRSDPQLDARFKLDFESTLRGVLETLVAAWSAQPAPAVPRRKRKGTS
jgi:AcrR family transcriptional regulator